MAFSSIMVLVSAIPGTLIHRNIPPLGSDHSATPCRCAFAAAAAKFFWDLRVKSNHSSQFWEKELRIETKIWVPERMVGQRSWFLGGQGWQNVTITYPKLDFPAKCYANQAKVIYLGGLAELHHIYPHNSEFRAKFHWTRIVEVSPSQLFCDMGQYWSPQPP